MKRKLLYIEDNKEIGAWVCEDLFERGYQVTWITTGEGAIEHMTEIDLVILDIMLPGLDGFSVGQRLKKEFPKTPILMLSARSSIDDKLQGLQFADDYMTKPFHPDELGARVEVLLRRFDKICSPLIVLSHLRIYLNENRIVDSRSNNDIILTAKQFQIFTYLLRHPNQILTKEQIYEAVWENPYIEGDKTLMVHIRHLREKVEQEPSKPQIIETIRGIGYRVKQ
ncbi:MULTISPECIES: response regulator transcription factor [unclassified Bacillus (in: firmicutes)]|uniref:response regulator transcription factor n=1 Tax=unclassified Bacillus (in: firmicutes) TaxID=185979 RepID=UPI0008E30703|nr:MULTISPECIES: response regulator transcription factor [unclassified Bacillus (in: firmicutes)]SFJ90949.1 DNA-binding response regulator, OmpR family, contains REC and winged-helix (wHTH) domain [Bacillus sp. 71mf]SFT16274.1 DNA-binding response regulator, OmpR family, contains REC and winged-helix (wHTH) domain [Bacillus sp. 103mf]